MAAAVSMYRRRIGRLHTTTKKFSLFVSEGLIPSAHIRVRGFAAFLKVLNPRSISLTEPTTSLLCGEVVDYLYADTKDKVENRINEIIDKNDFVYVLGFEHRKEYSSVILSFNTIKSFEKTLTEYQEKFPKSVSTEEDIQDLKYNYPGDFGYQGSSTKMSKLGFTFDNNMFKLLMDVSRMKKERFVAVHKKFWIRFKRKEYFINCAKRKISNTIYGNMIKCKNGTFIQFPFINIHWRQSPW